MCREKPLPLQFLQKILPAPLHATHSRWLRLPPSGSRCRAAAASASRDTPSILPLPSQAKHLMPPVPAHEAHTSGSPCGREGGAGGGPRVSHASVSHASVGEAAREAAGDAARANHTASAHLAAAIDERCRCGSCHGAAHQHFLQPSGVHRPAQLRCPALPGGGGGGVCRPARLWPARCCRRPLCLRAAAGAASGAEGCGAGHAAAFCVVGAVRTLLTGWRCAAGMTIVSASCKRQDRMQRVCALLPPGSCMGGATCLPRSHSADQLEKLAYWWGEQAAD